MKKIDIREFTSIKRNESRIGVTIEERVEKILKNKEPISDEAPIIFQERKEGVRPEFDIRTDRWELAIDAMDKISAQKKAKRGWGFEGIEESEAEEGSQE